MEIYLDCMPCFLRQGLDTARLITDDTSIHEQIVRDILKLTHTMDLSQSPPAIAQKIHRRLRELTGIENPYAAQKRQHNQFALKLIEKLEPRVAQSDNPLETAVRLAIAGNIIDLGVKTTISDTDIQKTIDASLTDSFDHQTVEDLRIDIQNAGTILYLTDNAGEIVLDRLLLGLLPLEKVIVAVKGSPIINDATHEDAEQAGLTGMVRVIDNGSDAPGTILQDCSDDFVKCFNQADLIIAKGQGNYETLSDVEKNIYFILKTKCPVIAADLGCDIGQMIIKKSNAFSNAQPLIERRA